MELKFIWEDNTYMASFDWKKDFMIQDDKLTVNTVFAIERMNVHDVGNRETISINEQVVKERIELFDKISNCADLLKPGVYPNPDA